jgi:hypothetical protein
MKLCFGSSKRVSGIFEEVNSQAVSGHRLVEWRVSVLMDDYSRSLPLLPDISRLYWQFGQYLEVEGPDTRGTIVRSIAIDHSGHEGVIRYARDLDRTGEEEKRLMAWWAQGARL